MQKALSPSSRELRYLQLLGQKFPTTQSAYTEIINLEAILNLPTGTEHFMSDIHGEYEAFKHIQNNCSGVIKERVGDVFGDTLTQEEQASLCTLIYYPHQKLEQLHKTQAIDDQWYYFNLLHMIKIARVLAGQYTRSKVRKAMPVEYSYIIDELLHASAPGEKDRHEYHVQILKSIVETDSADDFICSIASLIKRLAVDHVHIVGDLFDRGSEADKVIDSLMNYHSVDLQWGNHDIMWMGAAAGSDTCICSVVRVCIRYGAMNLLESGYGISLRQLALFAKARYQKDDQMSRMEKAISVMMFKLEGQLIQRHPEFEQDQRMFLHKLDLENHTVEIDGKHYPLKIWDFPTIDPEHPYELNEEEQRVLDGIKEAFLGSDRLRNQVEFLYKIGSMYKIYNNNLLFHGCIPLYMYGSFRPVDCGGVHYAGKEYLDFCDRMARRAWYQRDLCALDWMYYFWGGKYSPLSGRVVKTFERTFVADESTWPEPQDAYYAFTQSPSVCRRVLEGFGIDADKGHIINGHTPVKAKKGERPIKADGKLFVIDGGFCKAYHKRTGIAGYTLISSSDGMRIKAHRPFQGVEAALDDNADISSMDEVVETYEPPLKIRDTDNGDNIQSQIRDLKALLERYRTGEIKEHARW